VGLDVPWQGGCRAELEVVGGEARIVGYASVVDNRSNDPFFVPARPVSGPEDYSIVIDNRANAVLVDQLPEAVAVEFPEDTGRPTIAVEGSGNLGRPDLPLRVVCAAGFDNGVWQARVIGLGERSDISGYLGGMTCFIPDWIDRADNTGSVTVTVTDPEWTETLTLELDAQENCVLLDHLAGPLLTTGTAYRYRALGDGTSVPFFQILVMMRDPDGGMVVHTTRNAEPFGPGLPGGRLLATVLDWGTNENNSGTTVLVPY